MSVCHKRVPFISCLYTWVCERILSVFLRPPPSSWPLLLGSKTICPQGAEAAYLYLMDPHQGKSFGR